MKQAKDGYEEQLGRDSEKALETTVGLIAPTRISEGEYIQKCRNLVKRMERALGEENVVTLETLKSLGNRLKDNGQYQEAKEVYERCLAGKTKMLGEDHKDTLMTVNNLGVVYDVGLWNYEKALECFEKALKGRERMLGKNHPDTLKTVEIIAVIYYGLKDYEKAEELFERALEGNEAQFGKYHNDSKHSARNFKTRLEQSGNSSEKLAALISSYP